MKTFKTILAVLFLATFLFACEAENLEVVNNAIQDDIDLKTTQLNDGDIVTRSEDEDDMPEPNSVDSEDEDDMPEPNGADSEDEDDMPEPNGADSEDEDDMPEPNGADSEDEDDMPEPENL